LAYCHNWLGETLRLWLESANKPVRYTASDAEKEYDLAIALQQGLHTEDSGNPLYGQELARSYYNRGIIRYDGRMLDAAKADFLVAASLLQPLSGTVQLPPVNAQNLPNPSQDLARVYNNLGNLYLQEQQFEPAAQLFEQAIVTLNPLRERVPDNREYKVELATFYNNLALSLGDQRLFASAGKPNHAALDLVQELAEPSPSISIKRANILKLHDWIDAHQDQTSGAAPDPDRHFEFHAMYMGLGRSYEQLARGYLKSGNVQEAAQALDSMYLLLPRVTPSERTELQASYNALRKELNDKVGKPR